jgi:L-aspartate oxidase
VVKLLVIEGSVVGVQGLDFFTGENIVFRAKSVIMATGGLSRVYDRSTNPHTATGDGIALAYRAGALVADMEFIQFHPTALQLPGKEAFLISEAVRGEGAWLLNRQGERFMAAVHPLAELAPRDVVAYNIFTQMRDHGDEAVFLSLGHLSPEKIRERFATIDQKLRESGIDMTRDLIPVAPAAHYMVGGIRTGLNGETNLKGLFVCGEAASTGVMGANRLASNSLLECLVFGKRASEAAASIVPVETRLGKLSPFTVSPDHEQHFLDLKNELAALMSMKLGIIRNKQDMKQAVARIKEIREEVSKQKNDYNLFKIGNIVRICLLIGKAALLRKESRGGHIREDYPEEDDRFRVHIIQGKGERPVFEPVKDKQ